MYFLYNYYIFRIIVGYTIADESDEYSYTVSLKNINDDLFKVLMSPVIIMMVMAVFRYFEKIKGWVHIGYYLLIVLKHGGRE